MNARELERFEQDAERARSRFEITRDNYETLAEIDEFLNQWFTEECNGTIQVSDDGEYAQFDELGNFTKFLEDGVSQAVAIIESIQKQSHFDFYIQRDPRGVQIYLYEASKLKEIDQPIDTVYNTIGHACYMPKFHDCNLILETNKKREELEREIKQNV
mgnify:FL=1